MTTTTVGIPLVSLRKSLGDVISRVGFGHERTTISKNGKDIAAIIPIEDLELLNQLETQADLVALREARAEDDGTRISLADFKAGKEI